MAEITQDLFEREIILNELQRTIQFIDTDEQQFKSRSKDLTSQQRKFFKLQAKIEKSLIKSNTFDKEEQLRIRNSFNDSYYSIVVHLDKLKEVEIEQKRRMSSYESPNNSVVQVSSPTTGCAARLPTLPMPTFSGKITDFHPFYDLFKSLVHNKLTYSNTEKFRYLLLALKNEPYNLIKSIPITDENYSVALEMLISRYDNERVIASTHLDKILDIEPCHSDKSDKLVQSLRNLLNTYHENIKALEVLQLPTKEWSFILVVILLRKIPSELRRRFELSLSKPSKIPKISDLINFLEREFSASEFAYQSNNSVHNSERVGSSKIPSVPTVRRALVADVDIVQSQSNYINNKNISCIICGAQHTLTKCAKFLNLSPQDRFSFIKNRNVCYNCLSVGHDVKQCNSNFVCRSCQKRHHTLIHFTQAHSLSAINESDNDSTIPPLVNQTTETAMPDSVSTVLAAVNDTSSDHSTISQSIAPFVRTSSVLLCTALVNVHVGSLKHTVRCIIDTGSQATFITESCVQRLKLHRKQARVPVFGIGGNEALYPKGVVSCCITPTHVEQPSLSVNALILPTIMSRMPCMTLPFRDWPHLQHLHLADPKFYLSQSVEMLLGADILSQVILGHVVTGPPGSPLALNSIFGYLLMGDVCFNQNTPSSLQVCFSSFSSSSDDVINLKRFRDLESIPKWRIFSPDEALCETIFVESHTCDEHGCSVVSLPFKPDALALGEPRDTAVSWFKPSFLYVCFKSFCSSSDDVIHLKRFWEFEFIPKKRISCPDIALCEPIFVESHTCDENGCSLISFPFKPDALALGESRDTAVSKFKPSSVYVCFKSFCSSSDDVIHLKRFWKFEFIPKKRIFSHDEALCEPIFVESHTCDENACSLITLPFKPDALALGEPRDTAVLRFKLASLHVCFSCSSSSYDDVIHLEHVVDVLLGIHIHDIAFTADIKQIQQIYINILLQKSYRLRTIAFEVSSLPYLALRTIQQLAIDEAANLPLGPKVLRDQVFVNDVTQALRLQLELVGICSSARFELRKRQGNSSALLAALNTSEAHGERLDNDSFALMNTVRTFIFLGKTRAAPLKPVLIVPRFKFYTFVLLSQLIKKLKIFVYNRLSKILLRLSTDCWRHIPSADNAMDAPFRGMLPASYIEKTSSLSKLVRVTALIFRFHNSYKIVQIQYLTYINVTKFNFCLEQIIQLVQHLSLPEDIKNISFRSYPSVLLRGLKRSIDKQYNLRVGDRIHKSVLPFVFKHRLILPKRPYLTDLQYILKQRYWILSRATRYVYIVPLLVFVRTRNHLWVRYKPLECASSDFLFRHRLIIRVFFYDRADKVRNAEIIKYYVPVFVYIFVKAIYLELFLVGLLTSLPDFSLSDDMSNRLTRTRRVQQCKQHFWRCSSREYLHDIQQSNKWFKDSGSHLREGIIVVVRDKNLPPLQWRLARVHELHPASDNIIRVVTLQMSKTFIKRPVVKICLSTLE